MIEETDKPISRTEATLCASWLERLGIAVQGGWIGVYKLTPAMVATEYDVDLSDVLKAIRRG